MKFIKYDTKEEFLEENLEILLKDEAKNEIMIGIVKEHSAEKVNKWLLGRIEENSDVKAIFLVDDDKEGLLIYVIEKEISEQVANFLIDNIINLNIKLKEVLTSKENSRKIAEIYSKKAGVDKEEQEIVDIFKFDKFNEEHILKKDEKIKKIETEERILDLENNVKEMYKDTYHMSTCSDEQATKVAKIFIQKGLYVLINGKNEIVSQAVTVRKQVNSVAIGGVITPEKHRGYGYAKRCVYALCEKLLHDGYKFIVLHVNSKNEPAISIYKKIGFEPIDETVKVKFLW